eukprot:5682329-Prymnesium_polylepis.1
MHGVNRRRARRDAAAQPRGGGRRGLRRGRRRSSLDDAHAGEDHLHEPIDTEGRVRVVQRQTDCLRPAASDSPPFSTAVMVYALNTWRSRHRTAHGDYLTVLSSIHTSCQRHRRA